MQTNTTTPAEIKVVGRNKKAQFQYHIVERYEAGLVLKGSEVKSLRESGVSFEDSYGKVINGEVYVISLHISQYKWARGGGHDPIGMRKVLLNQKEIKKIHRKVQEKGMTIIPTQVYFKNGWAKVELALCIGKTQYDKRRTIEERENKRELSRISRERGKWIKS